MRRGRQKLRYLRQSSAAIAVTVTHGNGVESVLSVELTDYAAGCAIVELRSILLQSLFKGRRRNFHLVRHGCCMFAYYEGGSQDECRRNQNMGPTQQGPLASLHRDPRGQTQANARNLRQPHVFLTLIS